MELAPERRPTDVDVPVAAFLAFRWRSFTNPPALFYLDGKDFL